MADYRATDAELTAVADAIRTKGSTSSPLAWPNGFVSAVQAIPSGGGSGKEDDIIDGTISEYSNESVTEIRRYAFAGCYALTSAAFPAATVIGYLGFCYCSSLTTISFPAVTKISSYAFSGCSNLQSADFPSATEICNYAFDNCGKISTVSFPNAESIGNRAFGICLSLKTVSFPKVTTIGSSAFYNCLALQTAYFDRLESINQDAFKLGGLSSLYLLGSSVCTLAHSNAFSSTRIGGWRGTGYIYVPASLLSAYQAADNWSFFSSQFRSA